jgi:hypothetical protein
MVTDPVAVAEASALNCACEVPASTVTDGGTSTAELLLDNVTAMSDDAFPLSATVHAVADPAVRVVWLHVTDESVAAAPGMSCSWTLFETPL